MKSTTSDITRQERAGDMSLVRVKQRAQITLPAEARKALRVKEGDYLEAEVVENGVLLRPVAVIDRAEADRQLGEILSQVKLVGPAPSDDELMETVDDMIHEMRRENHAKGGAR